MYSPLCSAKSRSSGYTIFFFADHTGVGTAKRRDEIRGGVLAQDGVRQARADRTKGRTGLTGVEREELRRLRKENRRLRVERDVLKKAAAFFAKESE